MLRLITIWFYRCLLLVAFAVCITQGYRNRLKYETSMHEFDTHYKDYKVFEESMRKQMDALYQTVYTDPAVTVPAIEPPAPPRQPSYVELWQQNRDKELRDRISRLEQWRLRVEREPKSSCWVESSKDIMDCTLTYREQGR